MEDAVIASIRERRHPKTPAYALTGVGRDRLEAVYKRASSLRAALPAGVIVKTCEIVPLNSQYVSGLHVADNLVTLVGTEAYNRHKRIKYRALKALEARNG